jgi:hypothetical protein
MNLNAVAKHYDRLTPDERFRLILAAHSRGDKAEQDRLIAGGKRISINMLDHAPHALSFDQLAIPTFIELLEAAANYFDAFYLVSEAANGCDTDEAEAEPTLEDGEGAEESDFDEDPGRDRTLDLALAQGFLLKTRAHGWKLFCERLNVPPFVVWSILPGFSRLQRALKLAEQAAFVPEGMQRWLNAVRPAGKPEVTESDLPSAEAIADELEALFRQRVKWWEG